MKRNRNSMRLELKACVISEPFAYQLRAFQWY